MLHEIKSTFLVPSTTGYVLPDEQIQAIYVDDTMEIFVSKWCRVNNCFVNEHVPFTSPKHSIIENFLSGRIK